MSPHIARLRSCKLLADQISEVLAQFAPGHCSVAPALLPPLIDDLEQCLHTMEPLLAAMPACRPQPDTRDQLRQLAALAVQLDEQLGTAGDARTA